MQFSLSTRWNASRHQSGEAMIEEILQLGFSRVELGFNLTLDLVPGVKKMVESKTVTVTSCHNFCPVPIAAPIAHPELFPLCSLDRRVRESAVNHTNETIHFAAEMGAKVVVVHAGNIEMKSLTPSLIELYEKGRQFTSTYEKAKLKLLTVRDKYAERHLDSLYRAIDAILPTAQWTGVRIGFEIVPQWEGIPNEIEMLGIINRFGAEFIGYWHDMGHGQVRENLGLISHLRWAEKLAPYLCGVHVHDVLEPANDHRMPPDGRMDFPRFRFLAERNVPLVLEPAPTIAPEELTTGLRMIEEHWRGADAAPSAPAHPPAAGPLTL